MKIKIEKGMPIPTSNKSTYPFREMKIGDSFFVSSDKENSMRVCAYGFSRGGKIKFTTRKVDGGTRCWRVK